MGQEKEVVLEILKDHWKQLCTKYARLLIGKQTSGL